MTSPRRLIEEVSPTCRSVIVRHPKERKSKCSVEPLVGDERFHFVRYDSESRYDATGFIVLAVDAPPLSVADREIPFLILDSTWRYLGALRTSLTGEVSERSLPVTVTTAYPRVSKISDDPTAGLASVEALYAALRIVGERDDTLLDQYHWRAEFLDSCENAGL